MSAGRITYNQAEKTAGKSLNSQEIKHVSLSCSTAARNYSITYSLSRPEQLPMTPLPVGILANTNQACRCIKCWPLIYGCSLYER